MDTKEISKEQISALADSELVDAHVDMTLAVLRQPEGQRTWDLYHQIGDVLRSDEMGMTLSAGFAAKMQSRLDAEPLIVAPRQVIAAAEQTGLATAISNSRLFHKQFVRRFIVPGAAAAAVFAVVMFATVPQLSMEVADGGANGLNDDAAAATMVAATSTGQDSQAMATVNSLAQQGEVVRDPRIDDYLLAHQRFSPSLYSSVQYARSATFAIDADK